VSLSRRSFALSALGASAAAGLAACAGTTTTSPSVAASSGAAPSSAAAATGNLRFTWWGNAARAESTQKILDLFTQANPGIKVTGEPSDFAGYFDKLATMVAAGTAPDVITLGGAYLPEYASRGALADLAAIGYDSSGIDSGAVDNGKYKGKLYGATTGVNTIGCLVNPSLFSKAGISLPDDEKWTWDDYARIATEITSKAPGVYGASGGLSHDTLDLYARQRGEKLYTEDGKLGLTEKTVTDFLAFSLAMVKSKGAPPATVIQEQLNIAAEQTLMSTNKAAMMLAWSNFLTPMSKASGQELKLLKLPSETPTPGIWLQSSQFFAVYSKTKAPAAAAKLVTYLLSSTDAGKIVLNDRGVATNAKVRDAISGSLTPVGKAEVDYIARIGKMSLQPTFIGPTGSTKVQDITNRALSDVTFERKSAADAAKAWFTEAKQAIGQ